MYLEKISAYSFWLLYAARSLWYITMLLLLYCPQLEFSIVWHLTNHSPKLPSRFYWLFSYAFSGLLDLLLCVKPSSIDPTKLLSSLMLPRISNLLLSAIFPLLSCMNVSIICFSLRSLLLYHQGLIHFLLLNLIALHPILNFCHYILTSHRITNFKFILLTQFSQYLVSIDRNIYQIIVDSHLLLF